MKRDTIYSIGMGLSVKGSIVIIGCSPRMTAPSIIRYQKASKCTYGCDGWKYNSVGESSRMLNQ